MKNFFKNLITTGTGVSSKRVLSLFFALVFTGVVVVNLCGVVVNSEIIWSLVALIAGGAGMSTIEKFRKNG